jgi:HK97 family phage major capsid protein
MPNDILDITVLSARKHELITEAKGLLAEAKKSGVGAFDEAAYDRIMTEVHQVQGTIDRVAELSKLEETLTSGATGVAAGAAVAGQPAGWRSFGEQLQAVHRAAMANPGEHIDPRLTLRAATGLGEAIPAEGGFLVDKEYVPGLLQKTFEVGALIGRCQRITVGPGANGIKMRGVVDSSRATGSRWGGIRAYWLNEAEAKTGSKIEFSTRELSLEKIAALCYVTDELLQDSVALESLIKALFPKEFAFVCEDAIVSGTGAGQPLGILNSPCLVTVAKETGQVAATVDYQNIIKMWSRLYGPNRANSVWLINQEIEPQLHQMNLPIGTGGVPVYMPAGGLSTTGYSTLFGRPVVPCEYCSALGTVGDIILADFGEYLVIDKGGLQADSSIHVRFTYDETVYRFVMRLNGMPIWNAPLTPFKGSSTLSPFVTLATRA